MAVTKRTRFEVLRRDDYTCRYCRGADNPLTVDHVLPVALGGDDTPGNLVAACRDCNAGKSSSSPDERTVAQVSDDAVRWAAAMKHAAAVRAKKRRAANTYVSKFIQAACAGQNLSMDERRSILRFYEVGLPIDDLIEAARIASAKPYLGYGDTWRYMCGVAWKMVSEIQDAAVEHFTRRGDV